MGEGVLVEFAAFEDRENEARVATTARAKLKMAMCRQGLRELRCDEHTTFIQSDY